MVYQVNNRCACHVSVASANIAFVHMAGTEQIHTPLSYKLKVWQDYSFYEIDRDLDSTVKAGAICKMSHSAGKYTGSSTNLT